MSLCSGHACIANRARWKRKRQIADQNKCRRNMNRIPAQEEKESENIHTITRRRRMKPTELYPDAMTKVKFDKRKIFIDE